MVVVAELNFLDWKGLTEQSKVLTKKVEFVLVFCSFSEKVLFSTIRCY